MNNVDETLFKCQNCHLPLKIDSSLLDLSLAQKELMVNSSSVCSPTSYKIPQDRLQRLNKVVNPNELNFQKSVLDSYVFLQNDLKREVPSNESLPDTSTQMLIAGGDDDSGEEEDGRHGYSPGTAKTLSTQVSALANAFNILSSKSNIDYPVCQDCCDILIQRLQSEYDDAIKERDTYTQFLSRIEKQREVSSSGSPDVMTDKNESLRTERDSLFQELLQLEQQDEALDKEIAELEKKIEEKKRLEMEDLKRRNSHELEQLEFAREIQSLKNQYEFALNNLDKLRKVNIYNETFKISHEGPFGIINGLRIGGFEDIKVPWQEINAALGQIVLLLATIATKLKIKIEGYKLQPMGSVSKISKFQEEEQEWVTYEAYSSENFKLGKLFRKETSFDRAMECLLEIVQKMAIWLSRSGSTGNGENGNEDNDELELPYVMHKDKINGISVKLFGGRPNIEWTTAMKFLLTNAKWLLAFSSSRLVQS